jgi:hypothetical protein
MNELSVPRSRIIDHSNNLYKILATITNNNYNKEQLGLLVKYFGGNKILMSQNKLLICEQIEEANYVEI